MSGEPVSFAERPRHFTLKLVAFILSLGLLVTAITLGVLGYLRYESGYYELTAAASETVAYAGDVKALVYFEGNSASVRAQVSAANTVYSKALEEIYIETDPDHTYASNISIGRVSANPNTATALDQKTYALLKDASEEAATHSNFSLYGAPLYDFWDTLAGFPETTRAGQDPINNAAAATELQSLVQHVQSAATHCSLVFDDAARTVQLNVDDTYLAYRKTNEITSPILSFNLLRVAYECDAVSKALIAAGYTKGLLSSNDGLMMSLGGVDTTEYRLYDHDGTKSIYYGILQGGGQSCCVEARRFENDASRLASPYYQAKDASGTLHYRSPWINLQDGCPTDYLVSMAFRKKDLGIVRATIEANEFAQATNETSFASLKTAILKSGDLLSYNRKGESKKVYVNADESASLVLIKAEGYETITY